MNKSKLQELTLKLYECSMLMKEIDDTASDVLLELSAMTLKMYELSKVPDEIRGEVEDIKAAILSDD